MNKMTVIQLLNKIANGEEVPKKIVINDIEWIYDGIDYARESDGDYLFNVFIEITQHDLNMEVEIIEEDKKIEKLDYVFDVQSPTYNESWLMNCIKANKDKINKIIDYINKGDK